MDFTVLDWSTAAYSRRRDAADAWVEKLQAVYGTFSFDRFSVHDFSAAVKHRSVNGFQIVDCQCDPCGAGRGSADIGRDDRSVLALQLVLAGRERIRIEGREILLSPGDLLIWDTTRPMRFEVTERLHKLSVLMPLARLQSWLPQRWHSIRHKLDRDSSAGHLMSSYVRSIYPGFMSGAFSHSDALTEAAISLMVTALEDPEPRRSDSLRHVQLNGTRSYIEAHLDDPELSPASIAGGMRMSVRYLHWLFKATGTTVSQYVLAQRLLKCRRDLENPRMQDRKIADIACSAGFHNATHFARRFRDEFGASPKEYRAARCPAQGGV